MMSDTSYDPADPRLTAYVLGELDDTECRAVEQQLEQCAESRAAVAEIRETVGLVTSALATEPVATLTEEQRTAIAEEAAVTVTAEHGPHWRGQAISFVAGVSAAAAVILIVLPQLQQTTGRADGDGLSVANSGNISLGHNSSSGKYDDLEMSLVAQSGQTGDSASPGGSLSYEFTGDESAFSQRHGQPAGPTPSQNARTEGLDTSYEQALTDSPTADHWKFGGTKSNRPTTGATNDVPQSESAEGGRFPRLLLATDGEKGKQRPSKVKRSVGKEGGVRVTEARQMTPGQSQRNRPTPASPYYSELIDENIHRYSERERYAKIPMVDPNQIDRTKMRVGGTGVFERPVDEKPVAQDSNVDDETRVFSFFVPLNRGINSSGSSDNGKKPANEQYQPIVENTFLSPNNDPLSTFSIDVDTASYSNVRRFLKQNQFPPANAVRIEELVNYFHYDYPEPEDGRPFSVNLEAGPCPWNSDHRLVRVGLKGKEIDKSQRPPSNLVFLLDVSGSMRDANKLPLVKTAMEMLVSEMTEDDRIAIVTYAGKAGLKLPSTSGQHKTRIIDAIHALSAGGSTNGEAGIKLAYEQAVGHFIDDGANRVILCTDGDFNVGTSGDKELVTLIQEQAKSKVFLSVFGFGMGNLKDGKLEQIADKGNGQYGYIDNEKEAHKVFVEEMAGTLYTIAKDVKIQVEFNPQQVGGYRLIGYENRMLAAPDFNDDTKDAGEIGAGHTVTALYEIVPFNKLPAAKPVDDLKYQKPVKVNDDDKLAKELLTVKLRYKQPDADQSVKIDFTLTDDKPQTQMPSVDFEWAASCAGFGLLLRNSQYRGQADFDLIRELAMGSRGDDESGRRREFLDLVFTAHAMHARATGQPIPPRESLPEDKAREMAQVQGKYQKLLKRIEMPTDAAAYGQFTDFGYWAGNAWGNHKDLPKGHWVYVAPHWYIWGDSTAPKPSPNDND